MIALCSMWDKNYHEKGLALIDSLRRHVSEFSLCVLALDDDVYSYFQHNQRSDILAISLQAIETPELLAVKSDRTWVEYIWTITPIWTRFAYDIAGLGSIAYIDADCFLFADLSYLYDEVGNAPVAIIPHRWTPSHANRLRAAGIYNVSWVYFSESGLPCLDDWAKKCLEWCYWRVEADGRFADQGYLNSWDTQWGAYIVQNIGCDLAPWNQEQYQYSVNNGDLMISDGKRNDKLLFYHFHGFKSSEARTGYPLHPMVAKYVYEPYEAICHT